MISSEKKPVSKNRKVLIFESVYAVSESLLQKWISIAGESVERSNRFTVALSGGRSPMEFYSKLSNLADFDLWRRTHIFLADERFVPFDSNRSNYKMIKESLLDYVNIPAENIHPITTDQKNVDLSAEQYKNVLSQFFEFKEMNAPSFDLILLGVGDDGHTASLFANDPNIDDAQRIVLPVSVAQLKEERISLSYPVINNAKNVIVLVLGAKKADIISSIIKGKSDVPASKIDPINGQLTFLLDKEAAQQLSYLDSQNHEGQAVLYDFENH